MPVHPIRRKKVPLRLQDFMNQRAIILFDGLCNLCNGTVQFIIRHDPKAFYSFASLQSGFARKLLAQLQHDDVCRTIIYIEGEKIYTRSTAALKICGRLSGGWKLAQAFLIIPRFIRDGIYDFIARRRYRWFGKRQECMLPAPGLEKRFLA